MEIFHVIKGGRNSFRPRSGNIAIKDAHGFLIDARKDGPMNGEKLLYEIWNDFSVVTFLFTYMSRGRQI